MHACTYVSMYLCLYATYAVHLHVINESIHARIVTAYLFGASLGLMLGVNEVALVGLYAHLFGRKHIGSITGLAIESNLTFVLTHI